MGGEEPRLRGPGLETGGRGSGARGVLAVAPVAAEDAATVRTVDHEEPLVLVADEVVGVEAAATATTGSHVD